MAEIAHTVRVILSLFWAGNPSPLLSPRKLLRVLRVLGSGESEYWHRPQILSVGSATDHAI